MWVANDTCIRISALLLAIDRLYSVVLHTSLAGDVLGGQFGPQWIRGDDLVSSLWVLASLPPDMKIVRSLRYLLVSPSSFRLPARHLTGTDNARPRHAPLSPALMY